MNLVGQKIQVKRMGRRVEGIVEEQDGSNIMILFHGGELKKFAYDFVIRSAEFPDANEAFRLELEAEKQAITERIKSKPVPVPAPGPSTSDNPPKRRRTNGTLYIIMKAFSGDYLEKHIGHECINFFLPENKDDFLLYLNESGKIGEDYRGYDGDITLLTVENIKTQPFKYKILSKAEHCHILDINDPKYVGAKYGIKDIEAIYRSNHDPEEDVVLATFWAKPEDVTVPDQETVCTIRNQLDADIRHNISHGLRFFLQSENVLDAEAYLKTITWLPFDPVTRCLPGYPKDRAAYTGTETKDCELRKFALAAGMP